MSIIGHWKAGARQLKTEAHALYLACRDPRVPWYARLFAAFAVSYLLSPIDLIPDFIPILGYLDDLLLIPAFILIARRLIPSSVLAEHRERAASSNGLDNPKSWAATVVIIMIWLLLAIAAIMFGAHLLS